MSEQLVAEQYKQTEIGLIPNDWELKEFGEICYPSKARINPITSTENYKCVELEHLAQGSGILLGLANSQDLKSQKSIFEKGDVLFGKLRPYLRKYLLADFNGVCTTEIWVLKSEKEISNRFLYQLVQSDKIIESANLSIGTKMPRAEWKTVSETKIPFPPTKAEQTAIATALSDADALISNLEKLIAKKRNIKQGAMQKLLQPKEGWLHKSLGEVGLITGAGVDKTIIEDEVPIRLVNYMDVFRRDFIYSNQLNHWVTTPTYKAQKCAVQKGDIFFTPSSEMRFDIAISAVAMEDIPDAAYSYHLVRLRLFEDWDLNFRTYIFKTKYFLDQAEQMCEGSGKRYVISLPKFKALKIYIPPTKEEQTKIATILYDMDAEITALETKLEKYRKVKMGMMQNLLTGKIRLVYYGI